MMYHHIHAFAVYTFAWLYEKRKIDSVRTFHKLTRLCVYGGFKGDSTQFSIALLKYLYGEIVSRSIRMAV